MPPAPQHYLHPTWSAGVPASIPAPVSWGTQAQQYITNQEFQSAAGYLGYSNGGVSLDPSPERLRAGIRVGRIGRHQGTEGDPSGFDLQPADLPRRWMGYPWGPGIPTVELMVGNLDLSRSPVLSWVGFDAASQGGIFYTI
ncbi:hypothetical protein DSO57_1007244 [Entomophthora muscae]|uniref:Uncharacterized protein n=1 Tax=Entomophthora muscae TaxID=34485 RepID=A0ACC2UHB7_9FUNG|nr:hypothetical protein DSO57_1007244 [Entomophthora muscae]